MKTLFLVSLLGLMVSTQSADQKHVTNIDAEVLVGMWKLDMTPHDPTDDNYASMKIKNVAEEGFEGFFYREGVIIREGRLNALTGILHGALISGDGSGEYHTSFYYKEGKLYGTTHAIERKFLAVWTATKVN